MNLIDFIHESNNAKNEKDVSESLLRLLKEFGIDRFLIAELSHSSTTEKEKKFGIVTNYPREWLDRYMAKHYINFDPVYSLGIKANGPFDWDAAVRESDSPMALHVMNEAKEYGLRYGVSLPIHRPLGAIIGFSFVGSQKDVRKDKHALSVLNAASFQFYTVYSDLMTTEKAPRATLSERERDVLRWIACGKSKSEIADILTVSESCIKRYCESIFIKLDVNTAAFAVARAIRMGIVDTF